MKSLISFSTAAVLLFGTFVISAASADNPKDVAVSVMETAVSAIQDQDPPAPVPAPETQPSVSDQVPSVISAPIGAGCCGGCQAAPSCGCQAAPSCGCCQPAPTCCCKPAPPVAVDFCLVDPCGCSHAATVCLPADCVGQAPCVTWRSGICGRQIATMCWECCGHKVKVVVTKRGKVRVRG